MPSQPCYFVGKAEAASAAPALKIFCSILHRKRCLHKIWDITGFIGIDDIRDTYLPMGFSNFKIEGRSLGSALILEFLLYYMTKPEYQLRVREEIYLDSMLNLF